MPLNQAGVNRIVVSDFKSAGHRDPLHLQQPIAAIDALTNLRSGDRIRRVRLTLRVPFSLGVNSRLQLYHRYFENAPHHLHEARKMWRFFTQIHSSV